MAAWIYDRTGQPQIIVDGDRFLDRSGTNTVGWISGDGTFTRTGQHAGWFENGVLSDRRNQWAGFTARAAEGIASRPELSERPMPHISKCPTRPQFDTTPPKPNTGDFSTVPLDYFFDDTKPLAPSFYDDIQGV